MALESPLIYPDFTTTLLSLFCIYVAALIVYRLYFSPLAHIPGPKLWAATFWPEIYHDLIRGGRFSLEISALHKKYGPIVRINPIEVHISDPDYYDTIYAGPSRVTDKYPPSVGRFIVPHSFFTTVDHHEHQRLRAPILPYFSKQSIMKFSDDIGSVVNTLLSQLHELADTDKPCNLHDAYGATTLDVISEYSFCQKRNALKTEDFMPEIFQASIQLGEVGRVYYQMPWILRFIGLFPTWLGYERMVGDFMAGNTDIYKPAHPTILHNLLNHPNLRPEDKTVKRIGNEAGVLTQAGTQTTADTLKVASFYLLTRPDCLAKLRAELATVPFDPNVPTSAYLTKLEKLPYLTAVINESLRKGYVIWSRLQRISRNVPLIYPRPDPAPSKLPLSKSTLPIKPQKSYVIPPGTPVSMLTMDLHENPDKFPEPTKWEPDRWLIRNADHQDKEGKMVFNNALLRYIAPFSRGTRSCAGKELAFAEMYLVLARLFGTDNGINLRLCEDLTDERDVAADHGGFTTAPPKGRGGLWVKVTRV
ncbi:MAG: hypothetical protein Q9160_006746 [Pyrenula sp. 1 TL-2023]